MRRMNSFLPQITFRKKQPIAQSIQLFWLSYKHLRVKNEIHDSFVQRSYLRKLVYILQVIFDLE